MSSTEKRIAPVHKQATLILEQVDKVTESLKQEYEDFLKKKRRLFK